jgi:hypothetical protein
MRCSFLFVLIQKETKRSRQTRWLRPFCRAGAHVVGGVVFIRHPELVYSLNDFFYQWCS